MVTLRISIRSDGMLLEAGAVEIFPQEITRVLLNLISNGFYAATKRRETDGEDFEPVLSATPPRDLKGKLARSKWRQLAPVLLRNGLLTELDVAALMLLCESYELWQTALAEIARDGLTREGTRATVRHPRRRPRRARGA